MQDNRSGNSHIAERQKNGNSRYESVAQKAAFTEQQADNACDGSLVYMHKYGF